MVAVFPEHQVMTEGVDTIGENPDYQNRNNNFREASPFSFNFISIVCSVIYEELTDIDPGCDNGIACNIIEINIIE